MFFSVSCCDVDRYKKQRKVHAILQETDIYYRQPANDNQTARIQLQGQY